jgi:cation diffusion facilitator CzcD-associated flavoprotein CzcO
MSQVHSIAIIGTGFGGLGMAIRLKQRGFDDFVVLERAQDVGGTWRDNTYPGCACDVESHLYSFSFAPNPRWSRMYSPQPEIWQYLRECADRHGLRPRIRFGHELTGASWDQDGGFWHLETTRGPVLARVLVSAMGALCEPRLPEIPGIEQFEGKSMHSARWDHDYPLEGKRVAVIGTGASAIQFVPEIQPKVAGLLLFQRTPAWVIPHLDRPITAAERRRIARYPLLQRAWRARIFVLREGMGLAFRHPAMMKALQKIALRHMRKAVRDPALRAKLTPDYVIGCKRILLSNAYYPALAKENVQVVTEPIREIRARSIVTGDGQEHSVDAIIYGTGFQVTDMPFARLIRGREGRSLAETWQGSPRAHLGTTVPGFPNLFLLLGPGTGLGHSSVVLMIESQIEHVLGALEYMRKRGTGAVEPRPAAAERFHKDVQTRMRKTVWLTGGCASWYLDKNGVNSTLWPGSIPAFRRRVEPFKPSEYKTWTLPSASTS